MLVWLVTLRPFKWLRGQRFGPVIAAVAAPPWGWQDANRMLTGWPAKCQGQILQCSPHLDAGLVTRAVRQKSNWSNAAQHGPNLFGKVWNCEPFADHFLGAGCKLLLGPNALHALPTHAAACWNMLKHAETTRLFYFVWGCSCPSLSLNIFKLPDVDKLVESEKFVQRMNLLFASSAQLEVLRSWDERNSRRSRWASTDPPRFNFRSRLCFHAAPSPQFPLSLAKVRYLPVATEIMKSGEFRHIPYGIHGIHMGSTWDPYGIHGIHGCVA